MGWDDARYIGLNNADNLVSTSLVAADADGTVLERLEFIQASMGGAASQMRLTQSASNAVEENAILQFNIGIFDIDSGAVASGSIDITSITNVMMKSTGGAAFSASGITQPTFSKATGSVYCAYQFLAAEWQEGDMYKLTVGGITVTFGASTAYVPDMVWSNVVLELEDLEDYVLAIPSSTGANTWNATALASIEAEATDALEADDLDHLINAADGGTHVYPDSVAQDSIFAYIMAKGDPALATSYNNTTDSLEAISDKVTVVDGYHDVPTKDATTDTVMRDVVGRKTDTAATGAVSEEESLMAYAKQNVTNTEALALAVADTTAGKTQILEVSVTSAADAGAVTLATVTTQPCLIKSIVVHADTAVQTDLTSAAVTGGASSAVTFLSAADTAVANIDAVDEQVAWTGAVRLAATKTIVMTLAGGGSTPVDLTVTIEYCACVDGGYLV